MTSQKLTIVLLLVLMTLLFSVGLFFWPSRFEHGGPVARLAQW